MKVAAPSSPPQPHVKVAVLLSPAEVQEEGVAEANHHLDGFLQQVGPQLNC